MTVPTIEHFRACEPYGFVFLDGSEKSVIEYIENMHEALETGEFRHRVTVVVLDRVQRDSDGWRHRAAEFTELLERIARGDLPFTDKWTFYAQSDGLAAANRIIQGYGLAFRSERDAVLLKMVLD